MLLCPPLNYEISEREGPMVAARHPAHTFTQDYTPALADWRRLLEGCHARNLDFTVVFDGARNARNR